MTNFLPLVHRKFKSVLIANRAEIGVRVIRACRDLGISPHAVFSKADINSRHVALADKALCIGEGPSAQSYLVMENIIAAAKTMGSEAVHPGFGFLSESAEFAQKVLEAGLVWIGPSPQAIHDMGDKTVAKSKVTAAGVPCSPGKNEALKDVAELKQIAKEVGYPLILKAASGGGGRGMRVVRSDADLDHAYDTCTREALSYFGRPDVFCERYIERPRHIEIQVLADGHGNTIHLFDRDCTIQRRHQKLIEEAPSTYISAETRKAMGEVAVKAAQSVGYVNAGTVEFILESPTKFYFMEMNTRIQVEHPVTECITGVDLVQWQIKVAQSEALPWKQEHIQIRGHAMETRVNAEDAYEGFRPNPGLVSELEFPIGPGIRVDSHIYKGYKIPEFYDSMVCKLIAYGSDRTDCIAKLKRAIAEFRIEGVETTLPYTQALLEDPQFLSGEYTTRFVEENEDLLSRTESKHAHWTREQAAALVLQNASVAKSEAHRSVQLPNETWGQAARLEGSRRNT
jgi:acetyl-CoA carboxylase biotin carboxylase subunit